MLISQTKTASGRKRSSVFLSRRRLIRILFIELSAAKLRAFSILLQLRNERDRKPVRVFEARIP